MPRIRTIKPMFFRHEELQELELLHGHLKPMLVFVALWGHCDAEGRFEWKPRTLKLDILPFIPFDMEEALQLLKAHGFLSQYTVQDRLYGAVDSFTEHQRISGKEREEGEKFPSPPGKQRGNTKFIPGRNGDTTGTQRGNTKFIPGRIQDETGMKRGSDGDATGKHSELQEQEQEQEQEQGNSPKRRVDVESLERFSLTPEIEAWAVKEGIAHPGQYVEEFKDYWRSVGGKRKNGQPVKDWPAVFRNRLRQLKESGRLKDSSGTLEERLKKWAGEEVTA